MAEDSTVGYVRGRTESEKNKRRIGLKQRGEVKEREKRANRKRTRGIEGYGKGWWGIEDGSPRGQKP